MEGPFQNLKSSLMVYEVRLHEQIELVLTEPPYDIRQEHSFQSSEYDFHAKEDTEKREKLSADITKLGGLVHVLRFDIQFALWIQAIKSSTETSTEPDREKPMDHGKGKYYIDLRITVWFMFGIRAATNIIHRKEVFTTST